MAGGYPRVTIRATEDTITVKVAVGGQKSEKFAYAYPGIITGCELRDILAACGIQADYKYQE